MKQTSLQRLRAALRRAFLKPFVMAIVALSVSLLNPIAAKKAWAAQAELDVSEWPADRPITLEGPWAFYWQKLLDPEDLDLPPDAFLEVGASWKAQHTQEGLSLPGTGFGTYKLTLKGLPHHPAGYALYLPYVTAAARVLAVNSLSKEIVASVQVGELSLTPNAESMSFAPIRLNLGPKPGSSVTILIQVSNFSVDRGGVTQRPVFGLSPQLLEQERIRGLQEQIGLGINVSLVVYLLMMWFRNRRDLASLCLAMVGFNAVLRVLVTASWALELYPLASSPLLFRFEYATVVFGTIFSVAFFLNSFTSTAFLDKICKLYYLLASFFSLLPFVSSTRFFSPLLPIYQGLTMVSFGLSLVLLSRAIWKRETGAVLSLVGLLISFGGIVVDILVASKGFNQGYLIFPACFAVYLLLQAQVVARKAALAYELSEQLALELEARDRSRTHFFQNISHELRTPLNGIIGFLGLTVEGNLGNLPGETQQNITRSLRLAESLKLQVNTILDLAKAKRGELTLKIQSIALAELKAEADNLAEGLRLASPRLHYNSELIAENPYFMGDHDTLFSILRNLLGNAFKFSDPHRDNCVHLRLEANSHELTIQVKDSGIGMAADDHDKIFAEFGQIHADARRKYEGTGLGLSMVKEIVSTLGGSIAVDSTLGQGSVFRVTIPMAVASSSPPEGSLEAKSPSHPALPLAFSEHAEASDILETEIAPSAEAKEGTILVIDDHRSNCEVLVSILHAEGYSVHFALNGPEGLKSMHEKRPQLLLLDMMMPEMSGEDVLKTMKADHDLLEIPVIFITARASDEDRLIGLNMGADDYIAKPIIAAELRARVRNLLERHRLLKLSERSAQEDKLIQMGELFSELSHELKNILHGSSAIQSVNRFDAELSAAVLSLDDSFKELYAMGLLKNPRDRRPEDLREIMKGDLLASFPELSHQIRMYLGEFALELSEIDAVWEQLRQSSVDELQFAKSQLKLFSQHKILQASLERCRDLTLSVLGLTRTGESAKKATLAECWQATQSILKSHSKRLSITWKIELNQSELAINPSALMQVLLNLALNAVDAVASLEPTEQWVALKPELKDNFLEIHISNAGDPIPEHIRSKLFQRGFSTKGEKGSGIGLYASRRILKAAEGDLYCAADSQNPCFVIKVKRAH